MLTLYRSVVFGSPGDESAAKMRDLSLREAGLFAPLVLGVIVLGVIPNYVLNRVEPSVQRVIERYETKLAQSPAMPINLFDEKQDTISRDTQRQ
jgi:NADH-quinone oxidoreductase subunit M